MQLDRILVPLDGSLLAEAALPKAVELIRNNREATLILLRATEVTAAPGVDPTDAQATVVREAEAYLETVAARLREDGVPRVKTSVSSGAPAAAILEAARMTKPDLIMMGTHRLSGIGRSIVGSVAESVLRGTRTPVFLIRLYERFLGSQPPVGEHAARRVGHARQGARQGRSTARERQAVTEAQLTWQQRMKEVAR